MQTDQVFIRGQVSTANARVASKLPCTCSSYGRFSFLLLTFFLLDLESQVQALLDVAQVATDSVNARGGTVADRLRNIPIRV